MGCLHDLEFIQLAGRQWSCLPRLKAHVSEP